ncbi:MAG: hypothetical protein KC613_27635 [Myxococcales bacterium]|nr:hypothetical protein [Myxococcales bacterium]MCB9525773.1 hypothetical protein [Myxococcales bacterium]
MRWIMRIIDELRHMHRITGPAGTLLLASLLAAGLASVAHATPEVQPVWSPFESTSVVGSRELTAWLPPDVAAGEELRFVIELEAGHAPPVAAHLPGLTFERVPLTFDARTGLLRGSLRIPHRAPHQGSFTLRLTGDHGGEWDWTVALRAPAGAS